LKNLTNYSNMNKHEEIKNLLEASRSMLAYNNKLLREDIKNRYQGRRKNERY